jgi:hypothetical protein
MLEMRDTWQKFNQKYRQHLWMRPHPGGIELVFHTENSMKYPILTYYS